MGDSGIESKSKHFRNGDFYTGGWKSGLPEGSGVYKWTDGSTYDGEWKQGNKHGIGTYVWPSGAEYSGEWVNGCMQGYGTFKAADGSIYTGGWASDLKHGLGKKQYANGDKYDGIWKKGKPDGPGRYVWADGNVYNGEWRNGKMHGQGTFQWKTGERYDGEWKDGREDNLGTFQWKDNATYDGLWEAGKKHGIGIFRPAPPENRRATTPIMTPGPVGTSEGSSSQMDVSTGDEVSDGPLTAPSLIKNSRGGQLAGDHGGHVATAESVFLREYKSGSLIYEDALKLEDKGDLELIYALFRREEHGKIKRLLKGDNQKGPGEVIFKGHSSYDLMQNLQLGIQYSVGKINMVRLSENIEDHHFVEKLKLHFPRRGGNHTPPHMSQDFKWKDYAPMVFRRLREAFGIDPADYLISLCGNHALRELASPGKSGSIFYISHDDRFIIKTMKKGEMKHLFSTLQRYYEHMSHSPHTLITKFYGLHRVTPYKGNKIRFMVMNNLFRTDLPIHRKYDLKGSTQGRFTKKVKGEVDPHTTLKDLDLEGLSFKLEEGYHERLHEQLKKDSQLLEAMHVMDYSLLLGVHFRSKGLETIPDAKEDDFELDVKRQQEKFKKQISGLKLDERRSHELMHLVEQKLQSRKTMRNSSRHQVLARLPKRTNTLRPRAYADGGTEELALALGYDRVQLGKNMAATAVSTSETGERTAENVVLYFGVIDILQAYNVSKKIEHRFKAFVHDGKSISAVSPTSYAERFNRFMRTKVFL